jgi:hypothetical protein
MNDQSRILGVSMSGWISFILAGGTVACVLMKIPIDTQYFTIVNSVLIAYVAKNRGQTTNGHGNGESKL